MWIIGDIIPRFTFFTKNFVICSNLFRSGQEALVILSSSRNRNLGPWGSACRHCAYRNQVPLLLATPLVIHEKNWKCLHSSALNLSKALSEVPSSAKLSLNSCSQSGNSFAPPLLSDTGVSTPLLSDTESLLADVDTCDEDYGEANESVVGAQGFSAALKDNFYQFALYFFASFIFNFVFGFYWFMHRVPP